MSAEEFLSESRRIVDADLTTGPWMVETIPETGESRVLRRFEFFGDQLEVVAPGGLVREDAIFIAHARTALPRVVAALEEVLALHQEGFVIHYPAGPLYPAEVEPAGGCAHCGEAWPCATRRVIDEALNEGEEA